MLEEFRRGRLALLGADGALEAELGLQGVERVDIFYFPPQRFVAREAECEKRKAVSGHGEGANGATRHSRVSERILLKPLFLYIPQFWGMEKIIDIAQDMIMPFAEHIRDLATVREDGSIHDGDETFDRQVLRGTAGFMVLMI
ncbi:hypothetical protein MSC49_39630 (plasmid) [Methylosinus sp. C49]|nr:hypothetical protein MSC49_39630 [Methylosinus sp. C49]